MLGKQKKEKEFLELLSRYQVPIYRVCRMFAKNDEEYVSDLFNEVVLRLWEEFGHYGLTRFEGRSAESTWISQIAYNTVSRYNRKYAMKGKFVTLDADWADLLVSMETESDGMLFWESAPCLDSLDKNVIRCYIQGQSYRQIASELGMTETAVGTRMSRAIQKMKKYYSDNEGRRKK